VIRPETLPFRWHGVDVHPYKENGGTHFRSITRQTLHEGDGNLPVEMRYFEMDIDGYSTLERHDHQHLVMILRGQGQALVGDHVQDVKERDIVHVPPHTWHQFRANRGEPMGFLCVVAQERDKPYRPQPEDLEKLRRTPAVAEFLRV
jgi:quercetin dioxygenase-like cupin family protein